MLGYMYRYGQGVPQNFELARQWYRLAADQGHARAQNNLGALTEYRVRRYCPMLPPLVSW